MHFIETEFLGYEFQEIVRYRVQTDVRMGILVTLDNSNLLIFNQRKVTAKIKTSVRKNK